MSYKKYWKLWENKSVKKAILSRCISERLVNINYKSADTYTAELFIMDDIGIYKEVKRI